MHKLKTTLLALSLTLGCATTASAADALPTGESVIGQVDGKQILLGDIENREINELRVRLYEAVQQAFIEQALEALTESNAEYGKLQPQQITEADIKRFYQQRNLATRGSLEELTPQIRRYMESLAAAEVGARIYQMALEKGQLQSNLSAPNEFLIKVPTETAYLRGNRRAKVMMLEFSDYQCPYCRKVQPTIQQLIENYGARVAFGYRHFPLEFHREADDAAVAIECARDQEKFEPMHAALFLQQRQQSMEDLKALAKGIEMPDYSKFESCLDADTYRSRVNRDIEVGIASGISGTPGFIIGLYDPDKGVVTGELLSGAQPDEAFVAALDKYLARADQAD